MKNYILFSALCVVALCQPLSVRADPFDARPADSAELVRVLNSDAPVHDKAMACRALSLVGDAQAIDALAPLLADPQLATYARSALEAIPGEAAARALRRLLDDLEGELLVGVIDSVGRRRDAEAIAALAQLLNGEDRQQVMAAARALARIGDAEAARALKSALQAESVSHRAEVAWGALAAADSLRRGSEAQLGLDLLSAVQQADLPRHVALAADQQRVLVGDESGKELLIQMLRSTEAEVFESALQAARQLGPAATAPLLESLESSDAGRQVRLLAALGELADPKAVNLLLEYAQSEHLPVQREAVWALGSFPDEKVVQTLLEKLSDDHLEIALAARDALARSPAEGIDQAIVEILRSDDQGALLHAITVAGQRQIAAATEPLLGWAAEGQSDVQTAAIAALGSTIQLEQLPRLLELAMSQQSAVRDAAVAALTTACARLPRDEASQLLASRLPQVKQQDQVMLLQQLAAIGGSRALEAVAQAARSSNDAMQDNATQLLGTWPSSDVAPTLEDLAASLDNPKYRIRALRGYIRVARQLDLPAEERLAVCRRALELAERPEDRDLVLEVLRRNPNADSMAFAASLLDDDRLAQGAFQVLRAILPSVAGNDLYRAAAITRRAEHTAGSTAHRSQLSELAAELDRELSQQESRQQFHSLFDGTTLAGWHGNMDVFRVEDGQIVGGSLKQPIPRNEFLRTDQTFRDFELRLQFKLLGERPNAGVQIRTEEIPDHHEVIGYQADLGPGWWGCLYDESRRKKVLAGPPPERRGEPVMADQWNDYRILCRGKRIQLWINGVQTVDYTESDPMIPVEGIIALQVHSGPPMEARYRHIRIREE